MYFKAVFLSGLLAVARSDLLSENSVSISENEETIKNTRIIGGYEALRGQFPHLVSLQCGNYYNSQHFCAGSIIHPLWILTAAHCYFAYLTCTQGSDLIVRAGKHNINVAEPFEQAKRAVKAFYHEDYNTAINFGANDVAVLKLESPFIINNAYVKVISLPLPYSEPTGNVDIAGWGKINAVQTISPGVLQTVKAPIINLKVCNASINALNSTLATFLQESNICTGPLTGGVSHCQGDSGGSLTTNYYGHHELIGIVSWGFKYCGIEGGPAMSVKVSHYVYWIIHKMATN